MRIILFIAFGLFVSLSRADAADQPKDLPYAALNRALTEKVAVPVYADLVSAMTALAQTSADFCLDPPTGGYPGFVASFHAAMTAWQHAQAISFGPVVKNGRATRIEFWPDTGGSTDRQIRRALAERDPAMIAEGGLVGKSVALQSLSTFERLLAEHATHLVADTGVDDENRYACAWMTAIARFQARLVKSIADEWTNGFAATVIGAESGNPTYVDARAATTDYLKSMAGMLDIVVQQKLERPMDKSVAKARATRAESWRTKRSLANIVANLETTRDLFSVPGGFGDLLAAAGFAPLADGMRLAFEEALTTARTIDTPLEDAVGDSLARPRLEALLRQVRALRTLIAGSLASEIGLNVGFNSLDGD